MCAHQRLGPSDVGNVCVAGHESRLGLLLLLLARHNIPTPTVVSAVAVVLLVAIVVVVTVDYEIIVGKPLLVCLVPPLEAAFGMDLSKACSKAAEEVVDRLTASLSSEASKLRYILKPGFTSAMAATQNQIFGQVA